MTGWSISPARPEWATALTELALRSKASWGYDEEFMRRVASELRIGEDDIKARPVFSWVEDERPLGFYALLPDPPEVELDLFFVEPEAQRRGIGRALFKHAVMTAARDGWKTMTIQSDPFAVPFYLSRGAFRVGESRSPSTGRMLPLLHYSLPEVLTDADALRTYLGEIAGYPVVSEEEVRTLAQEIEAGAEATDLLTNESLEADERRRLRATRTTGEESKQKLIRAHLMLVVSLARRYEGGPGGGLLDLIQEGNIGLIRAVDKYDWRKGSFATFATPFIRRAIDRAVRGPEV